LKPKYKRASRANIRSLHNSSHECYV